MEEQCWPNIGDCRAYNSEDDLEKILKAQINIAYLKIICFEDD